MVGTRSRGKSFAAEKGRDAPPNAKTGRLFIRGRAALLPLARSIRGLPAGWRTIRLGSAFGIEQGAAMPAKNIIGIVFGIFRSGAAFLASFLLCAVSRYGRAFWRA